MENKKIILHEKELKHIISSSIKKILVENYNIDGDELMEYLWIKPELTGLNVDIFVDDVLSYQRNQHSLFLLVRNGYDRSIMSFIPITISENPKIIDRRCRLRVTYNDLFNVSKFIQDNISNIRDLADNKISHIEFWNNLKPVKENLDESSNIIDEMSRLMPKETNLPMEIWLDEVGGYKGHAPRLKFKASNEQTTSREFSTMTLTNPPQIENMPERTLLRAKDINKLKKFVIDNLELLLSLYNGNIDFRTQFYPNFKRAE